MEWYSYVIAIVLGISAVVSPIATAIINNSHQRKLKQIEIYEKDKKDALSDFISSSQLLIYFPDDDSYLEKHLESFNKLLIYFKNISSTSNFRFIELVNKVKENDCQENVLHATLELTTIVQNLSKEIMKE